MKAYYLGDPMGNVVEEAAQLEAMLERFGISCTLIPTTDARCLFDAYDVLFFDYGGMLPGSGMLSSLSRHLVQAAEEYPSRCYVMTSLFTANAVADAQQELGVMPNIFLSIEEYIDYVHGVVC